MLDVKKILWMKGVWPMIYKQFHGVKNKKKLFYMIYYLAFNIAWFPTILCWVTGSYKTAVL